GDEPVAEALRAFAPINVDTDFAHLAGIHMGRGDGAPIRFHGAADAQRDSVRPKVVVVKPAVAQLCRYGATDLPRHVDPVLVLRVVGIDRLAAAGGRAGP